MGRDMTDSRRPQDALAESERMARGIIDTALDAFVQMDEQGLVTGWNTQAEQFFGWQRDEVARQDARRTDRARSASRRHQRRA